MSKDARFWNRMAKGYFNQPIKDEGAYQIKLETTQEYLYPDMEILEVGCGTGGTAIAHAPFVSHVTATDISSKMLSFAEARKAKENTQNVTFREATVAEALAREAQYDAILMLSILHLLEDPQEAIHEAATRLKPSGYLVSSTPCLRGQLGLMSPVLKLAGKAGLVPRTIQEFSEDDLISWLEGTGLKTVHHWHPEGGHAVFTISQKRGEDSGKQHGR